MSDRTSTRAGWLYAAQFVVCISVLSIIYQIATERGIHVVAFILLSMSFAGAALLLATGRHAQTAEILREPMTWWLGAAFILLEASYYVAITQIPPAESSVILRLALPISLVVGVLLFARRPGRLAWVGAAVVVGGVGLMFAGFDLEAAWLGMLSGLLAVGWLTLRTFVSEWHPQNRAARTVWDKLRVTGVLIVAMSLVFALVIGALVTAVALGALPETPLLPRPAAFLDLQTIALSAGFGAAVFSALNYFQFSAVVALGSERFLAVTVLLPVAVVVAQAIASGFGLIAAPVFNWDLVPVLALVIVGSTMVAVGGRQT
ncbi:MAG: hypothetical protein AAFQ45_10605 [Pseudomonadota bacterium]